MLKAMLSHGIDDGKEDSEWLADLTSNYISRSEKLLGGLRPECSPEK
jgi:hypothetical protein